MWLRVTHILYTVCGNNTTSSANGQYPIAPISPLASHRGRARPPCGTFHDLAVRRLRPLRDYVDAGYGCGRPGGHAPGRRADAAASAAVDRAGDFRDAVPETSGRGEIRREVGDARRGCAEGVGWTRSVHQGHAPSPR